MHVLRFEWTGGKREGRKDKRKELRERGRGAGRKVRYRIISRFKQSSVLPGLDSRWVTTGSGGTAVARVWELPLVMGPPGQCRRLNKGWSQCGKLLKAPHRMFKAAGPPLPLCHPPPSLHQGLTLSETRRGRDLAPKAEFQPQVQLLWRWDPGQVTRVWCEEGEDRVTASDQRPYVSDPILSQEKKKRKISKQTKKPSLFLRCIGPSGLSCPL